MCAGTGSGLYLEFCELSLMRADTGRAKSGGRPLLRALQYSPLRRNGSGFDIAVGRAIRVRIAQQIVEPFKEVPVVANPHPDGFGNPLRQQHSARQTCKVVE